MMICAFCATLVGCSLTQFITDLIAALLSTQSVLEPPETWMGSRGGGVQSSEVVEKVFIAEHGGQRSQASML